MGSEQQLLHFFAFCLRTLQTTLSPDLLLDADAFLAERIAETYHLFTQHEVTYDDALSIVSHFFNVCGGGGNVDVLSRWKETVEHQKDVEDLGELVKRIELDARSHAQ